MKPLILVTLLLVPTTLAAQSLTIPTVVFGLAAGADWTTTLVGNETGATVEANPLLRPLRHTPVAMVTVGAALDTLGAWAWTTKVGPHHPRLTRVGLYAAAALRGYLTAKNLANMQRPTLGPAISIGLPVPR